MAWSRLLLRFALDGLRAQRGRSLLTMLGMGIGTASVVLVVSIGLVGRDYVVSLIEGVGSNLVFVYGTGIGPNPTELSFEDLRLLLALAVKAEDGPTAISELAELAGFPLDVAYPATHRLRGRGYLVEEGRRYSLSQEGQELVAKLDAAHRQGIQAYVDQMSPEERGQLESAFGMAP